MFEILLVVLLIGAIFGALANQVRGGLALPLHNSARVVAAGLRYASQRAVTTGRMHRFAVDLERQVFRIEVLEREIGLFELGAATHAGLQSLLPPRSTGKFLAVDDRAGSWRPLDDSGVWIDRIDGALADLASNLATVRFSRDGSAEVREVILSDRYENQLAIRVAPFTGEVRILELDGADAEL